MGLSPGEIETSIEAILDFAELGNFINTPMRFYSSGIRERLAFAIAYCIKPDILLLEEVFAVDDEAFRKNELVVLLNSVLVAKQLLSRLIPYR